MTMPSPAVTPPAVTTEFAVEDRVRERFDREGFVRLPGVLDPAVLAAWAPLISDKVVELNTQHLPLAERDTYGKAFLQVSNIWQQSSEVQAFAFSADLARVATELLGVRGVRMYHDQALYKEPGGGVTPWHADQYYWPFATDRCVTVWIPLQDTPRELGPLAFARGSHTVEFGRDLPISDESERLLQQELSERDFPLDETDYALGDVSFHLGWTFHRAGANSGTQPRRVMTMIYVDADMVVTEPTNDNQVRDLATWMPGVRPGGTVDSELNPVLWER
ncbi:ectoine hydroxylase-related dioxygenase (phytanoyl-CoA dioxygenase family) [Friedmanniella endophytica]|uniref:Ectoine hydroxylase-related dioxygenase (Phytanoyl-CoA dioxygenase family) n=1 Tax=Microlunatus kandeliicorticis TaxID=1759536 RepID=A0A7W3IS33_9ACTN|nr:phytanoyl-CoA dioxygenase family protein [Microlunatus kandeliicorticis]MBA8794224.1 ectoine hydroxylase-related dioxygenase (phytanoyl-CoA dioxygenase family) [Microlunatus kandeliicorticis]